MKKFRRGTAFFLAVLVLLSTFLQVYPAKAAEVDDNLKTVKIEQPENGRIYFSDCTNDISEKMFMLNSTCEFVVEPNEGYTLDGLTINYGDLQGSAANNINENVWSINVNTDLTISATFKKAENTEDNISETDVEDTEEIGEPETTEDIESTETLETSEETEPLKKDIDNNVEFVISSEDENIDIISNEREAAYQVKNLGSVTYGGSTVGHFTIDDKIAYCIQHEKSSPSTGEAFGSEIYNNDTIKKCLYYGWGGQKQWGGFDSESKGIVVTSLTLSHFYSGVPEKVTPLIEEFVNFINVQSVPDNNVKFSPSEVEAKLQEDGTQHSANITLNGSPDNSVTFTLQDGVTLVKSDGTEMSGTVTISGGTSFYLKAPLTVNDAYETGTIYGSLGEYTSVIYNPVKVENQKLIQLSDIATDPSHSTNLKVNWLKAGSLTINKKNGYKEAVSGAKFKIKSVTEGIDYDKTVTVKDGTLTITGLLIGKYEVKEISTPDNNGSESGTGYLLDADNTQEVEISAGETTTLNVENDEPTGTIHLTKEDSETGNKPQGLATLKGATYQLFANDNIVNANGTILYKAGKKIGDEKNTNSDGEITWTKLPMGKYYVKEVSASTGYTLDKTKYEVTLKYRNKTTEVITKNLTVNETVAKGKIQICKYDEKTKKIVTAHKATFGIYAGSTMNIGGKTYDKGNLIESVSTKDGVATSSYLPYGKYYVKESGAPSKYLINTEKSDILKITTNKEVVSYDIADEPVTGEITITKEDSETGNDAQGLATLQKAQYGLYAKADIVDPSDGSVLYEKDDLISKKTVKKGKWGDTGLKSTGENGQISWSNLPLGKYYVKEVKASTGYNLDETEYNVTLTYKDNKTAIIANKTTVKEKVIKGKFQIYKYDKKTGKVITANRATFNIYATIEMNIGGKIYKADDLIETITTVKGIATSSNLPYGKYYIKEKSSPIKYTIDTTVSDTFTIKNENQVISYNVHNAPVTGQIMITKEDSETGNNAQGNATLKDAQYGLYAKEDILDPSDGTVLFKQGALISQKTVNKGMWGDIGVKSTDENGNITWNNLPLGVYFIKEIKPSEGYNLDKKEYPITLTYKDNSTSIIVDKKTVKEDIIRGDIEISKFGKNSIDTENTVMKPLEGVIFSITSNTTGEAWYIKTNENGYADTAVNKVYSKIINDADGNISVDEDSVVARNQRGFLKYDSYTIKELNTPKGYEAVHDINFQLKAQSYKYQWILEDKDIVSALRVLKTDAETGKTIPMAGVTFRIYDSKMNPITMCVSHYPSTQYADKFTTDETGTFTFPQKLQVGTYYLEEISAPDGYLLGGLMQFTIEEGRSWESPLEIFYPNENVKGKIKIQKTDSLTGEVVEGAEYGIYAREDIITNDGTVRNHAGELVDTVTTDKKGQAISKELYLGKYYVVEMASPDEYKLNDKEYDVELTYEDAETPIVYTSVETEDEPNTIYILKKDKVTKDILTGATLQLINEDGEVVDEWVSDKEPHEITKLPKGTYTLHEKEAPDGYNVADDIEIELKGGIETEVIEMEDAPIQTEFEKFDSLDDENSLPGATYQLINDEGSVVDEWVTDGEAHQIYAPKIGTYTVHEVEAPEGYDIEKDYDIEIVESEKTQEFQMKDNPIRARISKLDEESGKSLTGATLQLIDSNGEVVDEWVSDEKPHEIYAIPTGTYTLHEKEAPKGYALAEDMEIEIIQTNEIQYFTMSDPEIHASIKKTDAETGKTLEGATLQLINEDEEIVDEWVTEEKAHDIYKLPVGTYTLHEEKAPDGYALAEDMEIEIEQTDEVQSFTMEDPQIHVAIEKLNHDTKKMLAGAKLQIIDKDGNVVEEWVTEEKAHEIYKLPVGTYTLHEEKAPEGFKVADDMKIEIVQTDEVQKFTMEDKVIGGIRANMNTDGRILEGGLLGKIRAAVKTSDGVNVFNIALGIIGALLFFSVAGIRTAYRKRKEERKETVKKKKLGLLAVLLFSLFIVSTDDVQAATKDTVTDTKEYTTTNKDETGIEFAQMLKKDGKSYKLGSVSYKILDKAPVKEKQEVTKTVESDLVKKTDEYTPDESITEDGIEYFLKDCTVIDGSEYTQDFTKSYDYLETDVSIPNNQVFTGTDENGNTVEINGKLAKQETLSDGEWLNTDVTIQFDHYDTGVFEWQGGAIENNSANPLEGHYDELLQSVGADTTNYRVVSTEWNGDAYESDGIVYRNAVAHVQYFVHSVRATYSGAIEYVKYESTYQGTQEVDSADKYSYTIRATATYERVRALTTTQIIIFTTIGIAVLAALVVLVLYVIAKKKEQKNSKEKKQIGKFAIKGGKLC